MLYCGVKDSYVEVFDGYGLKRVAQIRTKETVTRMIMVKKKYVICSELKGFFQVFKIKGNDLIFTGQLKCAKNILDFTLTGKGKELAIGLGEGGGLIFADITKGLDISNILAIMSKKDRQFKLEEKGEILIKNESIQAVIGIGQDIYLVSSQQRKDICVVDRL